ncbi:PTS mannose/fructose/sorbose transporter subunit IIC [Pectinatus frisingensis]|uniref:PTS mannose/fructose/sorbose transporter subunit IIC n=1 Tax=Pectinatus frisingensis TaxID=865 RepID=UPI0018C56415|nr:PTS mannose/fructose/sorbose transporter subunit IIC [Pectinatus frisingensis]
MYDISFWQIIAILVVAAIGGMDSVMDQFAFYRPLTTCTLLGLILGDVTTGAIIGGTLEMITLGWMNVGAAQAPDPLLASLIAPILVIMGHQSIGTGIAMAIPAAAAGQILGVITRALPVYFQHRADKCADNGNCAGIAINNLLPLILQALRGALPAYLILAAVGTGTFQNMLDLLPVFITKGLQVSGGFIVVVGYALVINMMEAKYLMTFLFLGFILAAFTNLNLVAFGVIGTIIAITYIQLNPKYFFKNMNNTSKKILAEDELD